ncbi:hypothetical protein [Frankia sp. Cj5]|uniref:hypothetical protein n=1 Tax=Frankia sp. Cj5 TaxID=2880978 RepID=UPI001EF54D7E|nr:hypothetical protein [Frankia sp. Cj5]
MELIFLLCFAYACYRAGLDAAVNGYALSRGRDVYIGEGTNRRHYSGFSVGVLLGVFFRSLVEGVRVGWPWARRTAATWREGRRRGDAWTPPWNEMRPPRRRRRRTRPAGATPPPDDGAPADPSTDEPDKGDRDEPDGDTGDRCARCGRPAHTPDSGPARWMPGEGWVCWSHFSDHCAACGNPARPDDPLILTDGHWEHASHRRPADDPPSHAEQPDAAVVMVADVVDADGRPIDAVWEPPAAGWASLHDHRTS